MTIKAPQNLNSLDRLLRLAREDIQSARIDLTDIASARRTAEDSLSLLKREGQNLSADGEDGELSSLMARRHNLQTTVMTLARAEAAARVRLKDAEKEIRKLERLLAKAIAAEETEGAVETIAI